MSWPDDGKPRFVVAEAHGYLINPHAWGTGSRRKEVPASVCVLDRAYAHRIVREFGRPRTKLNAYYRERAEELAASLNAADRLEEAAA